MQVVPTFDLAIALSAVATPSPKDEVPAPVIELNGI